MAGDLLVGGRERGPMLSMSSGQTYIINTASEELNLNHWFFIMLKMEILIVQVEKMFYVWPTLAPVSGNIPHCLPESQWWWLRSQAGSVGTPNITSVSQAEAAGPVSRAGAISYKEWGDTLGPLWYNITKLHSTVTMTTQTYRSVWSKLILLFEV